MIPQPTGGEALIEKNNSNPYHFGDTDPQRLVELLADTPALEVRIRQLI
nr:hypothetical protein [uncultured Desulfobulbus sp.]